MSRPADGRAFEPVLVCAADPSGEDRLALRAPAVGLWRGAPAEGELVAAGSEIGELEVLGVLHSLRAPAGVRGLVVELPADDGRARRPVEHGQALVILDTAAELAGGASAAAAGEPGAAASAALQLKAPSSGRFYARPSPDQPPFVEAGDVIEAGHTVCLLEVMKTFNRVTYGGPGLPDRARVVRVVPADESDLDAGDVILDLEPA